MPLKHVLPDAKAAQDVYSLERAANLAINYCIQLFGQDDFRNAQNIAKNIYKSLKSMNSVPECAAIIMLYGRQLRMNTNRTKAIVILNEALEFDEGTYSNSDLNVIRTDLAYAFLNENDSASMHAKAIEKTSGKDTMHNLQAKYVIAQASLKGEGLISRPKSLENLARRKGHQSLANNITLTITARINKQGDSIEKSKRLAKVVESKTVYTRLYQRH